MHGVIYPISDNSWVRPMQCVPNKGGMLVVANSKNELIHTRTATGWRICMDYSIGTGVVNLLGSRSFIKL